MTLPTRNPFRFAGNGLSLVGERWGEDGQVVVLLHGGGQTRHSWKQTAERLAEQGYTAVALDARGHGDSDWHPAQDYSLDGFVSDLVAYARGLEEPPVLVGASLGGITSLLTAAENPGLVRALVLVDVVVRLESAGVTRIQEFMIAHAGGFGSLDEAAAAVAAYNPHRRAPSSTAGLTKNLRQRSDGRWYWHWDPTFIRIGDEPQRHTEPDRLRAAAAQLDIPLLIVRGIESDVVSDEGLRDMLELVPHAEVVHVKAAGHMVAGDDNDVFADRLEEFLDRVNP
jgi:pimeloyl-ACP methyl ester carboxylesterase